MPARVALSTRISVAILVSLALITAAVALFVIAHTGPTEVRGDGQVNLTSVIAPPPASGATHAP